MHRAPASPNARALRPNSSRRNGAVSWCIPTPRLARRDCFVNPIGGIVRSYGLPRGPHTRDRPMPLAGTRRRTPNLATAEEIAAEYRNGPLRVPKAQAAQVLHDA